MESSTKEQTSPAYRRSSAQVAVIALLIGINFLFCWKYGARISPLPAALAALLLAGLQALAFTDLAYRLLLRRVNAYYLSCFIACCWVAASVGAHAYVPLDSLNVDRWSVIDSFLSALGEGSYPYAATSHMGNPPGPMPIYFFLAYPFWRVGWLSLLALIGPAIGLFWLTRKLAGNGLAAPWLLLVASSTYVYWEIAVRSNILTFSVLVMIGLTAWVRARPESRPVRFYGLAAVTGLLLATRSVFALAYILVYGSALFARAGWLRVLLAGVLSLLAFGLVFLPFYLRWPEAFGRMNPFIVQSGFLIPPVYVAGFLLVACLLLLFGPAREHPFLAAGGLLFGTVAVYALYHCYVAGFARAFFGSRIDLSYFLFAVPFLLYGATEKESNGHGESLERPY